ncbi:MAG: hypothetical protein QNJ68_00330 [Microcoleaceae cyanobacterium MO_207.B10]|nr:hypothetical protein [Microcoleaceae cyanobacterium MO_207.B10]
MLKKFVPNVLAIAGTFLVSGTAATAIELAPDLVSDSDLNVKLDYVGTMPFVLGPGFFGDVPNLGSPVPVGEELFLLDQNDAIYRVDTNNISEVLQIDEAPAGLTLDNRQSILNVAANAAGNKVFVVYTSSTVPAELVGQNSTYTLPDPLPGETPDGPVPDVYRLIPSHFQVMYEYDFDGEKLLNPQAIAAFETQIIGGHVGGALEVLPDGRLLFATGDALPFGLDGRFAPQDDDSHLSKILIVNPDNGSFEVAAKGVRNVQHFQIIDSTLDEPSLLGFADIGSFIAEEVNFVSFLDLYNTDEIENFGWGRNPDGLAREGTFYIGSGLALDLPAPIAVANAPEPESGFLQPFAQFGREGANFAAVSGPVVSSLSFDLISSLFGDLSRSEVFATTAPLTDKNVPVFRVNLFDSMLNETSLLELAGGRADPRFFTFSDGTAGVLLEATGDFYRLTELTDLPTKSVPEPASTASIAILGLFGLVSRLKRNSK